MAFSRTTGFAGFQFAGAGPYEGYSRRAALDRLDMLANVLLEGTVGAVPLAGDAFDVFFRANRRNVALLREHFARTGYA